jgi:hypothetical protein
LKSGTFLLKISKLQIALCTVCKKGAEIS